MDRNRIVRKTLAKSTTQNHQKTSKSANPSHTKSTLKGKIGEDRACAWLESKGFMIVERNFHTRFGEIDIIALEASHRNDSDVSNSTLHFIEVKSYANAEPAYAITQKKLSKIYQSIEAYFLDNHKNQSSTKKTKSSIKTDTKSSAKTNTKSSIALKNIDLDSLPYCVSAVLIKGDKISFLSNVSQNT